MKEPEDTTRVAEGGDPSPIEEAAGERRSGRAPLHAGSPNRGHVGPAEWLATSRQTRFIGCCYDPSRPANSWWAIDLRSAYDVIIHYASTGPTTVLPFQYPSEF